MIVLAARPVVHHSVAAVPLLILSSSGVLTILMANNDAWDDFEVRIAYIVQPENHLQGRALTEYRRLNIT